MTDKERTVHLLTLGMIGNLAQGITRIAMRDNRPVSQEEVDFIDGMPGKTEREISDFCFDRGMEPSIVLGIHNHND